MVIKIHESCCSIFNELCFSLHRLAARSLFIIPLCLLLVKRFFKLFSSFFARFLRNLAFPLASLRLAGYSLAAPIVYHILRPLSSGFSKFFPDFSNFFPIRVPVFLPFFSFPSVTPIIAAADCSSPIHRRSRSQHSINAIYIKRQHSSFSMRTHPSRLFHAPNSKLLTTVIVSLLLNGSGLLHISEKCGILLKTDWEAYS